MWGRTFYYGNIQDTQLFDELFTFISLCHGSYETMGVRPCRVIDHIDWVWPHFVTSKSQNMRKEITNHMWFGVYRFPHLSVFFRYPFNKWLSQKWNKFEWIWKEMVIRPDWSSFSIEHLNNFQLLDVAFNAFDHGQNWKN